MSSVDLDDVGLSLHVNLARHPLVAVRLGNEYRTSGHLGPVAVGVPVDLPAQIDWQAPGGDAPFVLAAAKGGEQWSVPVTVKVCLPPDRGVF